MHSFPAPSVVHFIPSRILLVHSEFLLFCFFKHSNPNRSHCSTFLCIPNHNIDMLKTKNSFPRMSREQGSINFLFLVSPDSRCVHVLWDGSPEFHFQVFLVAELKCVQLINQCLRCSGNLNWLYIWAFNCITRVIFMNTVQCREMLFPTWHERCIKQHLNATHAGNVRLHLVTKNGLYEANLPH